MLTQHLKYVTPKLRSVKFMTALALASASVTLVPMTAQASPGLDSIKATEYSAKFNREMFKSEAGIQQVYLTLQKKAQQACKVGKAIDSDGEIISKSECITDMLDQFVESADMTVLTAYHADQAKMGG